jgi:hypothetical protein
VHRCVPQEPASYCIQLKSKHAVLKLELHVICKRSQEELTFKFVSVEASGGVGFVATEVKVRRIVANCLKGRGYIIGSKVMEV